MEKETTKEYIIIIFLKHFFHFTVFPLKNKSFDFVRMGCLSMGKSETKYIHNSDILEKFCSNISAPLSKRFGFRAGRLPVKSDDECAAHNIWNVSYGTFATKQKMEYVTQSQSQRNTITFRYLQRDNKKMSFRYISTNTRNNT
jgi:hypothetical protein